MSSVVPDEGMWAKYELISTVEHESPPVSTLTLIVGPAQKVGNGRCRWWQVTGEKESGERYAVRLLSEHVPMLADVAPGTIHRYLLREGDEQPVEYVDSRTGGPLLPKFEFVSGLLPATEPYLLSAVSGTSFTKHSHPAGEFARTGTYLGHVIGLAETGADAWMDWPEPTVISLNSDEIHYMYGLARDTEGHYLKEGDYSYVALTRDEVDEIVELGMNSFTVDEASEDWVRRRPVFYYRQFGAGAAVKYPEVLYRSNYRGAVPFIDEPEIHILRDRADIERIRRPEQGAYVLQKRVEEIWNRPAPGEWRRGLLREQLRANGINLGTLTLDDDDHPIWVTMLETAFYQLKGGAAGVVHEGRYQLAEYIGHCERVLGRTVELTSREMLLMHYAFLRGAARSFGKSWGTAIYGQCDPEIAPEAITLAYDMGARYIWFWSYDHQHHLPHFVKIKLLTHLREHKAAHPRGPIDELLNAAQTAIVLPYGYGYYLEFRNMWDSPNLPMESLNDAGVPHREVMAAALAEGIACATSGEDFDFVIDAGQDIAGYKRTVRIGMDGRSADSRP